MQAIGRNRLENIIQHLAPCMQFGLFGVQLVEIILTFNLFAIGLNSTFNVVHSFCTILWEIQKQ